MVDPDGSTSSNHQQHAPVGEQYGEVEFDVVCCDERWPAHAQVAQGELLLALVEQRLHRDGVLPRGDVTLETRVKQVRQRVLVNQRFTQIVVIPRLPADRRLIVDDHIKYYANSYLEFFVI